MDDGGRSAGGSPDGLAPLEARHAGSDESAGDFTRPPRRQVALSLVCVGLAMFLAALSQTVVASIMTSMTFFHSVAER